MFRKYYLFSTLVVFILCLQSAYAAQKRVALVIGNSSYKHTPLKNPINDARDMANKLKQLGFEVDSLLNANRIKMKKAIRRFGKKLYHKDTVGLFYFAGHGVQMDGSNYLLPVKANIETEDEIEFEAINAVEVLRKMERAKNNLNLVILDACRNNPYSRSFRSASRGLVRMGAPTGSMILYATSPGNVAADGEGRNGLFTEKLLQMMDKKGIKIEDVFKKTAIAVNLASGKKQSPYIEGFILGDFYFNEEVTIKKPKVIVPNTAPDSEIKYENNFWDSIKNSDSIEMYKAYLAEYPYGHYVRIARIKLKELTSENKLATGNKLRKQTKQKSQSRPVINYATLTMRSNVNGDKVMINGKNYGSTRLDLQLKSGKYALQVTKAGYVTWNRNIQMIAGNNRTIHAKLVKITHTKALKTVNQKTYTSDRNTSISEPLDENTIINLPGVRTKTYKNGDKYIGQYKNNKRSGQGIYTWTTGDKYIGQYKNDQMSGKGTLYYNNGNKYIGQYENDQMSGYGTLYYKNGDKYMGQYKNNKRLGKGTYTWLNGNKYIGQYNNNKRSGQGTYTWPNGNKYIGQYENDQMSGKGTLYYKNGDKYMGQYKNNMKSGQGTLYYKNGRVLNGIWENDIRI
jgi:hypothetical protein